MAEFFPTIAIGGPGVNLLTAQIYEELPVAFTRDQEIFVQMDEDGGKRAAVWGMDHQKTREAVEIFSRDRFLDLVWGRAGG